MRIKKEMQSKNPKQHCFVLENEDFSFFFNCWLTALPKFAKACNVALDDEGVPDTLDFIGQWVNVEFIEKPGKKGELDTNGNVKKYFNVKDFRALAPDEVHAEEENAEDDADIPF